MPLSFVFKNRFLLLLVFLIVLILIGPLLRRIFGKLPGDYTENFLFVVVFLAALRSISRHRILFYTVLVAAGLCIAVTTCHFFIRFGGIEIAIFAIDALYVTLICAGILWHILMQQRIDGDTIMGGICVYLLLGMLWAFIYAILELLVPGSFVDASGGGDFLHPAEVFVPLWYFSYATLTTMGYGDIVPATETARGMAIMEAIFGQMYVIVFIARLLGLHVAGRHFELQPRAKQ